MTTRGFAVFGVVVCGQLLFGMLAAAALIAARHRVEKVAFTRIALVIGFTVAFVVAIGVAVANAAVGGSRALTAGLVWFAALGWVVSQVAILIWWWRYARRNPGK